MHKVKVLVTQLCPTLCNPTDCSPPGSSVHGILQARILEWVAIPFSRGSSQPRNRTQVSHTAGRFFIVWATREVQESGMGSPAYPFSRGSSRPRSWTGVSFFASKFFISWATHGAEGRRPEGRVPSAMARTVGCYLSALRRWGEQLSLPGAGRA